VADLNRDDAQRQANDVVAKAGLQDDVAQERNIRSVIKSMVSPLHASRTTSPEQRSGKLCGINGAISELMVCTDLLARGNQVFRAVCPTADCDLIAQSPDGELLRVEVKTVSVKSKEGEFASVTLKGMLR
jgi:hypothetical protein